MWRMVYLEYSLEVARVDFCIAMRRCLSHPPSHPLQVTPALDDDPLMIRAGLKQDPEAAKQYSVFCNEHPEVRRGEAGQGK